ncbi:CYTH domain-containing protein [Amaricoccus tamworthensis]|uniref:CYTH domain-containing protein n=1 Tax=Amaricoccus tamworthensis TaxID=57002 RepID=UPI003C79C247
MSTEIERKFLVLNAPDLDGLKSETVRQGYLSATEDKVEVRVRQKGAGFFLTVKSGGSVVRSEHEVSLDQSQFDDLWPATEGRRLEKTRYSGSLERGETFELDVYSGTLAPLMVVEVEFPSLEDAEAFEAPAWFGTEVSGESRFKNKALAVAEGPPQL